MLSIGVERQRPPGGPEAELELQFVVAAELESRDPHSAGPSQSCCLSAQREAIGTADQARGLQAKGLQVVIVDRYVERRAVALIGGE
jgi:hypothetical protein